MARAAQVALAAEVVVFGFDPDPGLPGARALQVVTVKGALPSAEVEARETVEAAAQRVLAGLRLAAEGRGRRRAPALTLVGIADDAARTPRAVGVAYMAMAPFAPPGGTARWAAVGRGLRLDAGGQSVLRAALERLRSETRVVAGSANLLGDVFTGDDLLRVQIALHGQPRSSERTFRRRVQELRDAGVLRPVRDTEVAALRLRHPRFRSPAGTGGRPPELLRYSGSGGEEEPLSGLRARRSA